MKIAINILKGFEIVITAIWGIIFGIFTPLSIMYADIVNEQIANHYIVRVWLINSVACYIAGTLLVMLKCHKTALCFHSVGFIVSLYIYYVFQNIYDSIEAQSPAQLYMPIIFVTLLTLIITVLDNYKKISERLETKRDKRFEPTPSVLGGEYRTDKPQNRKK